MAILNSNHHYRNKQMSANFITKSIPTLKVWGARRSGFEYHLQVCNFCYWKILFPVVLTITVAS